MARFSSMDDRCAVLNLSRLHLDDMNLEHIVESKRKQIQQLYLAYNRLSLLPPSVCLLSNLEYLDISNNAITLIPEDFMRLANLKTLVAKNNLLDESSFPKDFACMQVETLNLSGNRFGDIPMQFLKLTRLQSLSLGSNRLKSIPSEIENLTRYVRDQVLSICNCGSTNGNLVKKSNFFWFECPFAHFMAQGWHLEEWLSYSMRQQNSFIHGTTHCLL